MRTVVYVDGFNLYYGALRDSPFRWLDLDRLCRVILPRHDIIGVHYFTALVSDRPGNAGQEFRQRLYLRALRTLPNVRIHLGTFRSHVVRMPAAEDGLDAPRYVKVIKTEEKGSDVNLATQLVSDAYERICDASVVITNDSDLVTPIALVNRRLGQTVGVVSPHRRVSWELSKAARFAKSLRVSALAKSLFPRVLRDSTGQFRCPDAWIPRST